MKRTDARELAFKTIYSKFFNPTEEEVFDDGNQESLNFTTQILNEFANHYDEVNNLISSHLKGYTIERLYKIDLAILILAVVEIKYIGTPKEVAVNEAVELSKKFSTEKSPRFINGVLADILK